jgi:ubiquitin-conjugating enzyme (huntingtin interacting protein 2)
LQTANPGLFYQSPLDRVSICESTVTDTIDARYEGYHRDMVQRFVDLGFTTEAVVEAFKYVGIDRNNGQDYVLEEAYQGDIAARLYDA